MRFVHFRIGWRFGRSLLVVSACAAAIVPIPLFAQDVVGDVFASDASVRGSVVLTQGGTRVLSGSTVSAGMNAATVKLARGGAVRVCAGTNVSLSMAQSGRALSMGFSTGALELHYDLAASADVLQTSDLRFMLAGPGTFHIAISADALGNTCVKPMPQNTSSVIVQELFGDATYQVKADESVVFRKGHVADVSRDVPPDCGCPEAPPIQRAATAVPAPAVPVASAASSARTADSVGESRPVEAEAPFVYHADPAIPDPPVFAIIRLEDRNRRLFFQPKVLPPQNSAAGAVSKETAAKAADKGFFSRLKTFLGSVFK